MDTQACVRFAGGAKALRDASPGAPVTAVPKFV
jgi:hypothetical protein